MTVDGATGRFIFADVGLAIEFDIFEQAGGGPVEQADDQIESFATGRIDEIEHLDGIVADGAAGLADRTFGRAQAQHLAVGEQAKDRICRRAPGLGHRNFDHLGRRWWRHCSGLRDGRLVVASPLGETEPDEGHEGGDDQADEGE